MFSLIPACGLSFCGVQQGMVLHHPELRKSDRWRRVANYPDQHGNAWDFYVATSEAAATPVFFKFHILLRPMNQTLCCSN